VPRARGVEAYHPQFFARDERSERALLTTCAEMCFMGVSTRKVSKLLEKMGGFELSAATVSKVAADPDEQLTAFRECVAVRYEKRYPAVAKQIREQFEETLAVHGLPREHRRRMYTTNMLERPMRELKRRSRVMGIFPNDASCGRIMGAQLLERHERWECERARYLNMEHLDRRENESSRKSKRKTAWLYYARNTFFSGGGVFGKKKQVR
jgi:putative transposase